MERFPVPPERRRRFEITIRVLDLVVYAAVFTGGIFALAGTPRSVVDELIGAEWLIWLWSALLLAGGSVGFVGRLTRFWMVEVPATVLGFAGILIYLIVLGQYTFSSLTAAVATMLVLVALAMIARRWAELQIFATDPEHQDFRQRMADAIRRRTADFVSRME